LQFETFIDQAGNLIEGTTPNFLSPEWGQVSPFSLEENEATTFQRDGETYKVYYDPATPPLLDTLVSNSQSNYYKWGFMLVAMWGSHLDSQDETMWDISPNSIGNLSLEDLPSDYADYTTFYDLYFGQMDLTVKHLRVIGMLF